MGIPVGGRRGGGGMGHQLQGHAARGSGFSDAALSKVIEREDQGDLDLNLYPVMKLPG